MTGFQFSAGAGILPLRYRVGVGLSQRPVRWVSGVKRMGSWKLTTHLHLLPRLRMFGVIPSLP